MPTLVEAPETPPGLQHKSAITAEPIVTTDDRTGEVTAVVSVTNVVDEVGDIILPGAYTATLTKRKPKGVWSHSWKDWVARTEDIREYAPGDPQLKALLDEAGATLPANAGALVVRCKFNMNDPDSYKAYQKVKFFSETNECQWSIGYSVPPAMGTRDSKGIRRIKGLELFEYSPVLFGAASQSTSLSVKSVDPAEWPDEGKAADEEQVESAPAVSEDETIGLAPEDDTAAGDVTTPEDEVLSDDDPVPANVNEPVDDNVLDAVEDIAKDAVGDGEMEPDPDGPAEEVKRKFTSDQRDKAASAGQAMDDGSFPIKNEEDLKNAIQAHGRAKDPDAAKKHIIARAKALGLTRLLPDGWTTSTKSEGEDLETKYDTSPVGKPGGKQNWVDKAGGLPPFIRAVAHALIRAGHSKAQAIQIAVGTIRRWAEGGGDVTAKTRAKAAATIAEWEAKKGSKEALADDLEAPEVAVVSTDPEAAEAASGEPVGLLAKWDPTAEVGRWAAYRPTLTGTRVVVEAKDVPHLAGTQEERREMLRLALDELLLPADAESKSWLGIDGTWDAEVVASVYGGTDVKTYRVPYTLATGDGGDATVLLGVPAVTRLSMSTEDTGGDVDVPLVLSDGVDAALIGAKLLAASTEAKAGRVLSGSNATRIASAVETLISVLQSAGVQINVPADDETTEPVPDDENAETKSVESITVEDSGISVAELLADAAHLRALALRS